MSTSIPDNRDTHVVFASTRSGVSARRSNLMHVDSSRSTKTNTRTTYNRHRRCVGLGIVVDLVSGVCGWRLDYEMRWRFLRSAGFREVWSDLGVLLFWACVGLVVVATVAL